MKAHATIIATISLVLAITMSLFCIYREAELEQLRLDVANLNHRLRLADLEVNRLNKKILDFQEAALEQELRHPRYPDKTRILQNATP